MENPDVTQAKSPDGTLPTKFEAADKLDAREQPWKNFITVANTNSLVTYGKNESIRMIPGRADGKNLGG